MKAIPIIAAIALSACQMEGMDPVVSSYNGASVSIQSPGLAPARSASEEDRIKAQEVCGTAGKTARYASSRMASEYVVEFLFLCV